MRVVLPSGRAFVSDGRRVHDAVSFHDRIITTPLHRLPIRARRVDVDVEGLVASVGPFEHLVRTRHSHRLVPVAAFRDLEVARVAAGWCKTHAAMATQVRHWIHKLASQVSSHRGARWTPIGAELVDPAPASRELLDALADADVDDDGVRTLRATLPTPSTSRVVRGKDGVHYAFLAAP